MNKAKGTVSRATTALGTALLTATALTGCVGWVGDGGDGGVVVVGEPGVIVAEPDVVLFGGGYDRGRDVHDYSHRGSESRAVAHPGVARRRGRRAWGKAVSRASHLDRKLIGQKQS